MPETSISFGEFLIYLLVMAGVTYLVRLSPMLFIKKKITNRFLRSVLYYVPYSVLSVMVIPAIFFVTENVLTGILALAVSILLAYFGRSLLTVAAGTALTVLISELIIRLI